MDPSRNNFNRPEQNSRQDQDGVCMIEPELPTKCSICHNEPPINAVQLDCNHIFCFLCIKSASEITGLCPLCRAEIGIEFNFQEHEILGTARVPTSSDGYYWFYEGFKGWWLYDAETNQKIEEAHSEYKTGGPTTVERFIAGFIYTIDFQSMNQKRKEGDGRERKICRATLELENILGMAGLKGKDIEELLDMMRTAQDQRISNE